MALTTYHHGITATESSNITPIMKSVSMSTIALVSVSDDADDTAYPFDTPVLLTGITSTDVEKSGSDDQLLHQCLRTIKAIQNTSVVVLRLSEPVDVDTVDLLLSCQTSLGVTPKILIAPEIDTPAMTRKLVEIAKKRRAFVYASPRAEDGALITVKEDIVAYRDTFAARELMLIEGGFGAPGKSQPSDGSGGGSNALEMNFLKLRSEVIEETQEVKAGIVYKINDGLINTAILSVGSNTMHSTVSVFGAGSNSGLIDHFLSYEPDLFDRGQAAGFFVPMPLDQNASYLFGMDNALFAEFSAALGQTLPDGFTGIDGETVLTLYPASKLPSANIDYDVFDLIIDPASYTQADLQYFADRGVTPATKNPDGSYTLKSQLTLPPLPPPELPPPELPPLEPPSNF